MIMQGLFLEIFNLSLVASLFVFAVVLLRFALKKAPRTLTCFLWALVGIRLVLPFSIESMFSMVPSSRPIPQNITVSSSPAIDSGFSFIDEPINEIMGEAVSALSPTETNPVAKTVDIAAVVWLVGMILMICYLLCSYIKVSRSVREAVREDGRVYICDAVKTPFILGVFSPKIYIPSSLDGQSKKYVLAHENAHLRRLDHVWKPLGFMLLTLHWFNPLMWLAYVLLCRDIEFACDERVIKELGEGVKKDYSEALIDCSVQRRMITVCPLAFGEVSVKKRIVSVLNYKKPVFWVIVVAVIASVIIGIMFMTNRPESGDTPIDTENGEQTAPETEDVIYPETSRETEKQTEQVTTKAPISTTEPDQEPIFGPTLPDIGTELDRDKYSYRTSYGPVVEKGTQPTEFTVIYNDNEFDKFFEKYNAKYPDCFTESEKIFLKTNTRSHDQGKFWSASDTVVVAIALESNTPWESMFPHPPSLKSVRVGWKTGIEIDYENFRIDTGSTSVIFEFVSFQKRDYPNNSIFDRIKVNTFLPEGGTVEISSITDLKYETAIVKRYTGEGRVGQYFSSVFESVDPITKSFDQYDAYFDVTNEYYPRSYRDVVSKYDEEYFKDNVLIRVHGVAPAKGVYGIERIDIVNDIMRIVRDSDGVIEHGKIDPFGYSYEYYIFIEMPREQYLQYNISHIDTVSLD
ncbi:MAG: M56 family metallopeptidase [Ruminococcaceae bacterium]|nr:M56 family metallopeptidase [Oscillospiraceae bacterium]